MLNSSDKSQLNHDTRNNEEDDSLMMTIEYLRARLLSERSISRVAKERADDLFKRVKGLEEQLKVVTFQRKRAEKAALDEVSYLDSLEIGDSLEVYECDSDEDEYECESNMDNSDKAKDDKKFESFKNKGNDKESSGSEHESTTPSSGRSLSWKGRKESAQPLDVKLLRSRGGLAQLHSSPRHRLGKSCRQIRKRELRSSDVKLMHAGKSDTQDSNFTEGSNHCQNCLDIQNGKLKRSPERCIERGSKKDEIPHSSQSEGQDGDAGSSTREHECTGEMERALQHQAQLIRSYEAQEKAQRDWEEKYRDNNDSCEPGSHSDVTEERDENKAVPHPVEVNGQDDKTQMETNARGEKRSMTQFNSFKISPDADLGSSGNQKLSEKPSTSADFAFCVADNSKPLEHAGHSDSTHGGSAFYQSQAPQNLNTTHTLVHHREPAKLGSVLEALQEAKQMIKQHMNSSSETRESVGKSIEVASSINRDFDWLKFPVGCPGLFRVPTEFDGQALNQIQSSSLSLNYPSEPTTAIYPARTAGHYVSKPMDPPLDIDSRPFVSTPMFKSELEISNRQPRSDFFLHKSPNQIQKQFQGNEAGRPTFGYPSFQNFEFNPNAYK